MNLNSEKSALLDLVRWYRDVANRKHSDYDGLLSAISEASSSKELVQFWRLTDKWVDGDSPGSLVD